MKNNKLIIALLVCASLALVFYSLKPSFSKKDGSLNHAFQSQEFEENTLAFRHQKITSKKRQRRRATPSLRFDNRTNTYHHQQELSQGQGTENYRNNESAETDTRQTANKEENKEEDEEKKKEDQETKKSIPSKEIAQSTTKKSSNKSKSQNSDTGSADFSSLVTGPSVQDSNSSQINNDSNSKDSKNVSNSTTGSGLNNSVIAKEEPNSSFAFQQDNFDLFSQLIEKDSYGELSSILQSATLEEDKSNLALALIKSLFNSQDRFEKSSRFIENNFKSSENLAYLARVLHYSELENREVDYIAQSLYSKISSTSSDNLSPEDFNSYYRNSILVDMNTLSSSTSRPHLAQVAQSIGNLIELKSEEFSQQNIANN